MKNSFKNEKMLISHDLSKLQSNKSESEDFHLKKQKS